MRSQFVRLCLTVLGAIAVSQCADSTGTSGNLSWSHGGVSLQADDFSIEVNGVLYRGNVPGVRVDGDPGIGDFKTLEIEWTEHGTEMRLFIYLKADAGKWWSNEIRTYDGAPDSDGTRWVYYYGPFFETATGSSFTGDVDLTSDDSDNGVVAKLHFTNLRLSAF
jgi:hypothetical protein